MPAPGKRRSQARSQDGKDHLRQEHRPVLGTAEPVALRMRTGKDGTGSRECNQGQALDETRQVHQADFAAFCHHTPLYWFHFVSEIVKRRSSHIHFPLHSLNVTSNIHHILRRTALFGDTRYTFLFWKCFYHVTPSPRFGVMG